MGKSYIGVGDCPQKGGGKTAKKKRRKKEGGKGGQKGREGKGRGEGREGQVSKKKEKKCPKFTWGASRKSCDFCLGEPRVVVASNQEFAKLFSRSSEERAHASISDLFGVGFSRGEQSHPLLRRLRIAVIRLQSSPKVRWIAARTRCVLVVSHERRYGEGEAQTH